MIRNLEINFIRLLLIHENSINSIIPFQLRTFIATDELSFHQEPPNDP